MKWLRKPLVTKPPVVRPMGWEPVSSVKCVRFIVKCLLPPLVVLLLISLSACSKVASITPMPAPPANLASECPQLSPLPDPFLDPERLVWELNVLTIYADCAAKHRAAIEAWQNAVSVKDG